MENRSRVVVAAIVAVLLHAGAAVAVQAPGPTVTGNPTPGVEQPPFPVLADRITVTGCVTRVGAAAGDPNSYSDERFALTNVTREAKGPVGSGTSAAATAPPAARYRL